MQADKSVTGIFVYVSGEELSRMSHEAVKYHEDKAATYRAKAQELRRLAADEERQRRETGYSNAPTDPSQEMEHRAAEHERKRRLHAFLATHYGLDQSYTLRVADLELYGLQAR